MVFENHSVYMTSLRPAPMGASIKFFLSKNKNVLHVFYIKNHTYNAEMHNVYQHKSFSYKMRFVAKKMKEGKYIESIICKE